MMKLKWIFPLAIAAQVLTASAHTVWLEADNKPNQYQILFGGHAGKLEPLQPEKLKLIKAYNSKGETLPVQRKDSAESSELSLSPDTALVTIHYDNGIWSKNRMGKSVNKPMSSVQGATKATNAVKYHKTVLQWSGQLQKPLGQEFEVVPLSSTQPVAGKPMLVKILLKGEPLADVKLGHGEKGAAAVTNAQGIGEFIPKEGFNKLWAGKRFAVEHKDYTELSYEYLLGFHAATKK